MRSSIYVACLAVLIQMVALANIPANCVWAPNPGPQTRFLASPYREVGYGGSAGGGKSAALLAAAIRYIDQPDSNGVIFRRSYPELRNLIRSSLELYPKVGGVYNRSQHEWKFPSGAALIFRFVGASEDVYAYQGDAFSFVGWDELTQFPGDAEDALGQPINFAYQYMFSRLRRGVHSKVRLQIRATYNPGGIGHTWIKNRFAINDAGDPSLVKDPITGLHRAFIPARIKDNPHLAGSEYERSLESLPEALRRALRDGRWDIFAGAMFSQWNPRCGEPGAHIVEPFHIPSHWPRWRGGDDGFAAPAAVVWMAKDPDTGQIVVYQELYRKQMTAGMFADAVKGLDRVQPVQVAEDPDPQDGLEGILDSAAFSNNGQSEISRGDAMNRQGCRWKPAEKGPGSRILRVKAMHERMAPMKHDPLKRPGIVFFKTCKNCTRTMPALPIDIGNPEDIDTEADDHLFDATTYSLQWRSTSIRRANISGF
jgi:hypothetical protein